MASLISLTTKTRGRNSRDVEYQGFGKIVKDEKGNESVETDGVVGSVEELLAAPGIDGNLQKILDFAVVGYNKYQRDLALDVDEFAGFIQADWDEKRTDAFKRSVRALAKVAEMEISEAAELVLAKMQAAAERE